MQASKKTGRRCQIIRRSWLTGAALILAGTVWLLLLWLWARPTVRASTLAEISEQIGIKLPPSSELLGSQYTVYAGGPISYLSAFISVERPELVAWMDRPSLAGRWETPTQIWGSNEAGIDFLSQDPYIARHRGYLSGGQLSAQTLDLEDLRAASDTVLCTGYVLVRPDRSLLIIALQQ